VPITTELSSEERRQFVRDGFMIRRGCVSADLLESAKRKIEGWYGSSLDEKSIQEYTNRTFAPALGSDPDLLNVYEASGLSALAGALVSPDVLQPVSTVQIQIRIPEADKGTAQPRKAMHVDGVACPHLDARELRTFTMLVGVLLTEVRDISAGALQFVPGAHQEMSEWFRDTWTPGMGEQVPQEVEARASVPFLGKPGDAILLHHLVPHGVGPNTSSSPRIMLYFRVKHERHEEQLLAALRDPWLEFPALRELSL
jgi:hypothetical protein